MKRFALGLLLGLSLASGGVQAAWQLDNEASRLSFVSIKKGDIGEIHFFKTLSGEMNESGQVTLEIDLASVDTNIPVRDERMRNMLFETEQYPTATFRAELDMTKLKGLKPGEMLVLDYFSGNLELHGVKQEIPGQIAITRLDENSFMAVNYHPLLISADNFKLAEGVEKLREIAGLPSISLAVPINFVLTFRAEN